MKEPLEYKIEYTERFTLDEIINVLGVTGSAPYRKLLSMIFGFPQTQSDAIKTLRSIIQEAERIDNEDDRPDLGSGAPDDIEDILRRMVVVYAHAVGASRRNSVIMDILSSLLESIYGEYTFSGLEDTAERWITALRKATKEGFN